MVVDDYIKVGVTAHKGYDRINVTRKAEFQAQYAVYHSNGVETSCVYVVNYLVCREYWRGGVHLVSG